YLSARAERGDIAARFVAMVVQRSPIGALVAASSPWRAPADLAGLRVGGDPTNPQVIEFLATLDHLGIARPTLVELDAPAAPAAGLAEMADRYGDDRTDDAPEGWRMLEQFVFTDRPTGSMDADRWRTTLDFLCAARGFPVPAGESVYRSQFLDTPAHASHRH